MVLPFQLKDELCIKLMGRTNTVSTLVKYMYLDRYFLAMAYLPVFIIMLSDILPELCIVGFILDAAFKDIMEHMEDVEERIHEARQTKTKALNDD
ncbi:hypothetical protein AC1031_013549 [Aphanomyces cochlioides]|nr:hypothetical protein AC1031_013549 [Aphanomyces cochlioides]